MKRIILAIVSIIVSVAMSAQVIKVYKNGALEATYTNTPTKKYKVYFKDANLLPGKFSVGSAKQVQFTRSNLYWDGSAFRFEANQTDYQTSWNASHVDHFYWSKTASVAYAETYSDASAATTDALFCAESTPLTVEGTKGLYVLNLTEWQYLINRDDKLYKLGVTVTNGGTSYTNCLIIAPDDFTGTLASYYTLEEVNNLGLVCLPAALRRQDSSIADSDKRGFYWASPSDTDNSANACFMNFNLGWIGPAKNARNVGYSIRLVHNL